MAAQHADIVIVGGGLMGSSLAVLLAQTLPQLNIVLVDKNDLAVTQPSQLAQPSFDSRSTALSPTTVEMFKSLDLWPQLAPSATAIRRIDVSDLGHWGRVRLDEADNNGAPLGYVVENQALGWALSQALGNLTNVRLTAPCTVLSARIQSGGAYLEFNQGHSVTARLLIIADGADSPLRGQLGIHAREVDYQQHAIVTNVIADRPHGHIACERFTDAGPLALLPLTGHGGRRMAVVWSWPSTDIEHVLAMTDTQFLARLQSTFGFRFGHFSQVGERVAYPLRLLVAEEQVRRHVVVMGNAAHFLHPVAGQGFNLAARDALRLAEVLRQVGSEHLGDLSTLLRYERHQATDQFNTINLSDGFHRWFSNREPVKAALRTAGMFAVQQCSPVRALFIEQMSGRASPRAEPWRRN